VKKWLALIATMSAVQTAWIIYRDSQNRRTERLRWQERIELDQAAMDAQSEYLKRMADLSGDSAAAAIAAHESAAVYYRGMAGE
jgi:hypothetical protein